VAHLSFALIFICLFAVMSGLAIEVHSVSAWCASVRQRRTFQAAAGLAALVALGALLGAVRVLDSLPR
jgi:heme A synthase